MPGLIINGKEIQVPGLKIINWKDDPQIRLRIGNDGRPRNTRWVRCIVPHITGGPVGGDYRTNPWKYVQPGRHSGDVMANKVIRYWTSSNNSGGAHLIVDWDCDILCTADLLTEVSYHATTVNEVSIGIEMVRGRTDGLMYTDQLDTCVALIDTLTRIFGIQRQIQRPYRKYNPPPRISAGAKDVVGVFGHRDQTTGRGPEDPGEPIMELLMAAGYESVDYYHDEDLNIWKLRQREMQLRGHYSGAIDGIAGPGTTKALKLDGMPQGLWTPRPGD